jgi:hypothetical protein
MSYEANTKSHITFYVTLNNYTKDQFGNTNFNPCLSEPVSTPIVKPIEYGMMNYNSLSKKTSDSGYTEFKSAYNPPNCEICSKY